MDSSAPAQPDWRNDAPGGEGPVNVNAPGIGLAGDVVRRRAGATKNSETEEQAEEGAEEVAGFEEGRETEQGALEESDEKGDAEEAGGSEAKEKVETGGIEMAAEVEGNTSAPLEATSGAESSDAGVQLPKGKPLFDIRTAPRFSAFVEGSFAQGDEPATTGETEQYDEPATTGETEQYDEQDVLLVDFSDCEGFDGSTGQSPTRIGVESAMGRILLVTLDPAIEGIPLLGIPSAETRAKELLENSEPELNQTELCVQSVVAGSEMTTSKVLVDFFLERIPFVGCPTVMIKNTWHELRSIAIITALYGHDLTSARVKHEILLCLIPGNQKRTPMAQADESLLADTARRVAKLTIKGAIRRATGIQVAADCVELCSRLYGIYDLTREADQDGFVHLHNTPTAAARSFFRPNSANALPKFYLPLLVIGCLASLIFQNPLRFVAIFVALSAVTLAWHKSVRFRVQIAALPRWALTAAVFGLHAALPMCSAHASMTMVLPWSCAVAWQWVCWRDYQSDMAPGDMMHYFAMAIVGLYNLSSVLLHHLDQRDPPRRPRPLVAAKMWCYRLCVPLSIFYVMLFYETYLGGHIASLSTLPYFPSRQWFLSSCSESARVFIFAWISVCSQQKLVESFKNARELLFRLIGAENVVATTLCLLLKGVAVISASGDLATFLNDITPPRAICCMVVALRSHAVIYGILFALLPLLQGSLVSSVAVGIAFGSVVSTMLWGSFTGLVVFEWIKHGQALDAPAQRLAYVVPGEVSRRALTYLSAALAGAKREACRMVAAGLLERLFGWIFWVKEL